MSKMTLKQMQNEVLRLNYLANKMYRGKYVRLPLSIVVNNEKCVGTTVCKVDKIDLQEKSVEFCYGYEDGPEDVLWECLPIEVFEKHVQNIIPGEEK